MSMQWEDPPLLNANKRMSKYQEDLKPFVDQLRERPGEWAFWGTVKTGNRQTYYQFKRLYPNTEWTRRIQPDRTYKVWGRWNQETQVVPQPKRLAMKDECLNCGRHFKNANNLSRHEETCNGKQLVDDQR